MVVKLLLRIICLLVKDLQGSYDRFRSARSGIVDIGVEDPNLI
jgi:hypothetical protein